MTTSDDPVLIYAAAPDEETANDIAAKLLTSGLVFDVHYWTGMTRIMMWGNELHSVDEVGMILFTRASLADRAIAEAKTIHPDKTPTFVVLEIKAGHVPFVDWIMPQTKHPS